jgi:hypothetical protein
MNDGLTKRRRRGLGLSLTALLVTWSIYQYTVITRIIHSSKYCDRIWDIIMQSRFLPFRGTCLFNHSRLRTKRMIIWLNEGVMISVSSLRHFGHWMHRPTYHNHINCFVFSPFWLYLRHHHSFTFGSPNQDSLSINNALNKMSDDFDWIWEKWSRFYRCHILNQ